MKTARARCESGKALRADPVAALGQSACGKVGGNQCETANRRDTGTQGVLEVRSAMIDEAPLHSVARSRVEMTQHVLPEFSNSLGNIFGGQVTAWMDICGGIAAQRHSRSIVVTAAIDAIQFILPIKQGHIVILRGQVNATFRTSMECGVSVWSENPSW